MAGSDITEGSLVLYKGRPARAGRVGDRLEIELASGEVVKVRGKDVVLLHPGPLKSPRELHPQRGEVETAWEILAGTTTTLPELAELAYGDYTPETALSAWELIAEGVYFRGTPNAVVASTPEEVARKQAARAADVAGKEAWERFLERLRSRDVCPEDRPYLQEVEQLALKLSAKSRVLRELGREESPENAHALLLKLGYWDWTTNPYLRRFGLPDSPPEAGLPELAEEPRLDLTHLPAYAVDDEGSDTPDDALSLDGSRIWVHVADAAALVIPGSAADLEARNRGASIHLPEGTVPMLPPAAVARLGLGFEDVSPAVSFGLDLGANGEITDVEITPSWVRVMRCTYDEVESRIGEDPFLGLLASSLRYQAWRRSNGAVSISFPEVRITVQDGRVAVDPLPPLQSRTMVQEAMIMAGEAAARFALEREIPLPFATQEECEVDVQPESLSEMYVLRRGTRRSRYTGSPAPHAGLGLPAYAQATSPLRRYLDLVVHQQLRAHLRGNPVLGEQEVMGRAGATEAVIGSVRRVQQFSDKHWVLVYLLQHPDWRGTGVLIEKRGLEGTLLICELGLEVRIHLPSDLPLDSSVPLLLGGVDLPRLEAHFRVQ